MYTVYTVYIATVENTLHCNSVMITTYMGCITFSNIKILLNQVQRSGQIRSAHTWFLKVAFVCEVHACVRPPLGY